MKKKNSKNNDDEASKKDSDLSGDEEAILGEDSSIDPAIIEDTFIEEFSEYNDVDNF